jgi:hypothetical protein
VGRAAAVFLIAGLATGLSYYVLRVLAGPDKALIATAACLAAVAICRLALGERAALAMAATVVGVIVLVGGGAIFTVGRFYGLW